jgi:hypothetical protein
VAQDLELRQRTALGNLGAATEPELDQFMVELPGRSWNKHFPLMFFLAWLVLYYLPMAILVLVYVCDPGGVP